MKITLTGAAGNITKPLAIKLSEAGHQVSVIGRNKENLKPLTDKGINTLTGDIEDKAFVEEAFYDTDVAYTMIPAPYHLSDWVHFGKKIGDNYLNAIQKNNIPKVVNLSTYGAHRNDGKGAINSISQVEKALADLTNTQVINLRAGYFYSNLYRFIDTLKTTGLFGSNYTRPDQQMILVHTKDIAATAYTAITTSLIPSHAPYYVVSDIRTWREVAAVIGNEIGKELQWTSFQDDELTAGLLKGGFPDHLIDIIIEIGQGISGGIYMEHYFSLPIKPPLGEIKLEDFAKEFKQVYTS